MPHAEKCPVCNGVGTVPGNKPCHGCKGAGWVTVPGEAPEMPRVPPDQPPHTPWPYGTQPWPRPPWEPYIVWGITTTDGTARPGPAWTASVPA